MVYRTYWDGQRLAAKDYKARGYVVGDLRIYERAHMSRIHLAQLLGPDGSRYVIPPVDRASIEVRAGWVRVEGNEILTRPGETGIKNIKYTAGPQEWWCRPLGLRTKLVSLPVVELPPSVN